MTWHHHPDVVWTDDSGTVYAVAPVKGEVVILDGSAALIWKLFDGHDSQEVVDLVAEATSESPELIADHVTAYLAQLARNELATHG